MKVQSVAMINCRKPHFTAAPRKELPYGFNSQVTLQDLYDSEDRIMEHQEKLINKQNSLIANALNNMANYIVVAPDEAANKRFGDALNALTYSDSRRQKSQRVIVTV